MVVILIVNCILFCVASFDISIGVVVVTVVYIEVVFVYIVFNLVSDLYVHPGKILMYCSVQLIRFSRTNLLSKLYVSVDMI